MKFTTLDYEALSRLKTRDSTQADLVRALLPVSGESYIQSRIRTLVARGLLTKERRDNTNTRYLSITQAGRDLLETMNGDTPRPTPTPGGV